jgi:intraflagellar transport protein 122
VWSSGGQGLLKYSHATSIQAVAYNPVTQQLASVSEADLGLWSPEIRSVPKLPLTSRPLSLAWAPDGQCLAVGCEDGTVSLRDKAGTHRAQIVRDAPIWALAFAPRGDQGEQPVVTVGSWDGTLSFHKVRLGICYQLSSQTAQKARCHCVSRIPSAGVDRSAHSD